MKASKRLKQSLRDLAKPSAPDPVRAELRRLQKAALLASQAVQADRVFVTSEVSGKHEPRWRSSQKQAADNRRARRTRRRYLS